MLLLKALPELLNAAFMLALWMVPSYFGIEWFRAGVLTMLLEFFAVHAGGFMMVAVSASDVSKKMRTLWLLGLAGFYLLFMSGFAWGFDAWWMLGAFAWLCFGKVQAVWTGAEPTDTDRSVAAASWAFSVVAYLGSVAVTVIPAWVPILGVTPRVVDAAGFDARGGVWEAEPHRALAGAVLYFAIMGLSRPLFARWQQQGGAQK
jgi:hypothetical protein